MGKSKDLTGQRFGRLVVIKRDENRISSNGTIRTTWLCKCNCGKELVVERGNLTSGHTVSCGCLSKDFDAIKGNYLIGKRFGRLTVKEYIKAENRENKRKQYLCVCDCGNIFYARKENLLSGRNLSCGCYKMERYKDGHTKTHGMSKEKIYSVWRNMIRRCYDKNNKKYNLYGDRGISVCPEWLGEHGFENFAKWSFENGYKNTKERNPYSLDRINNDGNYEPSNCRWANAETQGNNKRVNKKLKYKGEEYTTAELSRILNIPYTSIYLQVIKKGKSVEEFLSNYTAKK